MLFSNKVWAFNQDMQRAFGDAILAVDFAPFHRTSRSALARTRELWALSCGAEPYDMMDAQGSALQHSSSLEHTASSQPAGSLMSIDVEAAIQRQQSFPFQVEPVVLSLLFPTVSMCVPFELCTQRSGQQMSALSDHAKGAGLSPAQVFEHA